MRLLTKILVLFFALMAASAVWLWESLAPTTVAYRYRLSIAIEVDGQVRSESSVIEVQTQFFSPLFAGIANGARFHASDTGQAVLFELGARGALAAALGGENYDYCSVNARDLLGRAYEPAAVRNRCVSGYARTLDNERALSKMQVAVQLTQDNMPAFYWFPDPSSLATVKLVKPEEFAAVIGDEARLVSAQVEITHDPIVFYIDKKLPAYAALRGPPNNGFYTTPGGLTLGWRQFIAMGNE